MSRMHKNTLKEMNNKGKNKTKTFAKEPEKEPGPGQAKQPG